MADRRLELRQRIEAIRQNVAEGKNGGWDAKGYTKEQKMRCKRDARRGIGSLKRELRILRGSY